MININTATASREELEKVAEQLNAAVEAPFINVIVTHGLEENELLLMAVCAEHGHDSDDCGYFIDVNEGVYYLNYAGVPHPAYEKCEIKTTDYQAFIKAIADLEF